MVRSKNIVLISILSIFRLSLANVERASNKTNEGYELLFVHILYRHGDRNIIDLIPNDPYKDEKYWPGGYGALTNEGKRQLFELGKYIRRRYKNFIGKYYSPNEVYVRSSDADRCQMSAQANLAALYPPVGEQIWHDSIPWQPIPVHAVPQSHDHILYTFGNCPRHTQLFKEFLQSADVRRMMQKHATLIDFLKKNAGLTEINLVNIAIIRDVLGIENARGFALPDWAKVTLKYEVILEHLATMMYEGFTHTNEMKKLQSGFLIKEILDRFKNKSQSLLQPDRFLWMYSAHDLTITNVLNTLNLYDDLHIPSFGSSLFFELHRRDKEHYIQLFYRRTPTEEVPPLKIPNCDIMCPLEQFYRLYADVLPNDTENRDILCQTTY